MKTLVISQSLPPFNDSSSIQLIERVRRLPARGHEVVLVGPEAPGGIDTTLLDRLPAEIAILRTPPPLYDAIAWQLRRLGRLGRYLTWVWANATYRLLVPDQRAGWQGSVVRLCKKQLPFTPDVVISSGGSYTAHLAALPLARHFQVPWVADLGDPWSLIDMESPGGRIRATRNRRLEMKTIPLADGLVVTTNATMEAYRGFLGDAMPLTVSIPAYGFNSSDFIEAEQTRTDRAGALTLSHIGVAWEANRSLLPAIEAISAVCKEPESPRVVLNVVGPHSGSFETTAKRLRISARFTQRVSFDESLQWLSRADALLIVGNAGALQVPGKVYTYLGSDKTIVYARQRDFESDPAAQLLSRFPGVIICENTAQSIIGALDRLLSDRAELAEAAARRRESSAAREYESDRVADSFVSFVEKVVESRRPVTRMPQRSE